MINSVLTIKRYETKTNLTINSNPRVQHLIGPINKVHLKCLFCRELIKEGERWKRIWDSERVYYLGVHDRCSTLAFSDFDEAREREEGKKGYP